LDLPWRAENPFFLCFGTGDVVGALRGGSLPRTALPKQVCRGWAGGGTKTVPLGLESRFLNQHEGDDGCRWREMKNVNFAATLLPRRSTLLGYDCPKGPDWVTNSEEPSTWLRSQKHPSVFAA
jgi:hypothetical protein